MSNLIDASPEAAAWVQQAIIANEGARAFGKSLGSVIWTNTKGPDGVPVAGDDPLDLIAEINSTGLPLFKGHDPGFPVGRVVAARLFENPVAGKFVAAILGFYDDNKRLNFSDLAVDPFPPASSPAALNELDANAWLEFATDPREVDTQWANEVLRDFPLKVKRVELSHNAAEAQSELIRIGLVFVALVWNPFVTTVATEAGKAAYAGIHQWMRGLWSKLSERNNPIVVVQSHQDGCEVSFIFRGKDVKLLYEAHDALPLAAVQAATLISSMKSNGAIPTSVIYEFEQPRWYPAYAILESGQIVSDRNLLIAIEQLPRGLSIGIRKQELD